MVITDMGSDHYCLRWNNHQNNLLGVFSQLLQEESLVDVTLACSEGHSIRAHKVVLSACSSYFQSLFLDHPSRHPIIILKDVCFNELRTLIEFMYRGEVNIEYCRLPTLLKTAESLQVKGLAEMTHLPPNLSPEMPPGNNQPPPVSAHKEAISLVTRPRRSHSSDDSLENDSGAGCAIRSRPSSIIKSVPPARLPSVPTPVEDRSVSPDPAELEAEADLEDDASSDRSIRQTDDHSDRPFHPFIDPVQDAPLPLVKQELDRATEEISSGETSTDGRRSVSRFHDPIIPTFPFELPPYRDSNSSFIFPLRSTPASPSTTARSGTSTSAPSSGTASSSLTPTSPLSQSSAAYGAPHFFLPPFHLPVLQPRFYPSDSAFSIYSLLQQQLYPAVVPPRYSSPNDLPWATSGAQRTFIKCAICQAAFPNGWLLEQHTILQHRGSSSGGGGGGGTAATQHQATANSRKSNGSAERAGDHKPFQCGQCGQSYRYRSAYVKHREQDHRARLPADKLFTCDICGMQFRYLKSFEKHRLNHSVEVVQPQSTGTANSNAVSAAPTKVEGSSSSSSNSQQRKASSSSSSKLSSLEENMSESQSDNPLTTDYPHQEQEPQQQQQQHEHEHEQEHAISLRRESGASGASSVAATDRLLSESRVSSSNEVDGQAASTSSGSSSTKGGGGGGGESSSAERGLYNILHYPERQRERQQFACSFCSKTVRSKENLKLHVRKHTGERPYACLFCGRAFGGKSDLTRHVRIHTGERPYHCEMCGKCFARADYLSKHLTTHLHNNPRTNAATAD